MRKKPLFGDFWMKFWKKNLNFWDFRDFLTRAYLEIMQFGNIISSKTFSVKSRVILFSPFVILLIFKNF